MTESPVTYQNFLLSIIFTSEILCKVSAKENWITPDGSCTGRWLKCLVADEKECLEVENEKCCVRKFEKKKHPAFLVFRLIFD